MNKNISPKIRFKGHIDAWEQRKVTELLKNTSDAIKIGPFGSALKKSFFTDKGIKVYAQENAFSGDFSIGNYYISEAKYNELKSCELKPGDLVISMMGTVGACAIFPENAEKGIMNSHLLRLQFSEEVLPEYIMFLLRDSQIIRDQIDRLSVGSIMTGLSSKVVKKLVFPVPKRPEQQKIVELLKQLDNLITLHQRKHIKLQNAKKSMLWKMFPHNDNEIPEVRLKGFTGAWSLRKLNTFVNYSSSNLAAKDSMNKGRYDLYDANNIIGKTDHTPMAEEYITIIKDGAGVGRIRMLPKNSMFIGTMGALTAKNSNLNFVFTLLTANNLGNSFSGSTIPHIYFKDYGENAYYIPNYDEQCAIGAFFKNLDDLIESENRYINKLLLMKQAFLNKMFVKVEA